MEHQQLLLTFFGRTQMPTEYWSGLVHSSIWARTWLVKELLMTKLGWPVAQPRFTSLPSARRITWRPLGRVYRSTWGRSEGKELGSSQREFSDGTTHYTLQIRTVLP